MRPQEVDKYCGKLPFASEVLGAEESYVAFVPQQIEEPVPAPVAQQTFEAVPPTAFVEDPATLANAVESIPVNAPPSIYDQPKQQILNSHYESQAREEERVILKAASTSIDLTANGNVNEGSKTARMDVSAGVANDDVPENEDGESASTTGVQEHRSLLHFLLGFLPGASMPQTWRPAGTVVVLALILFMGWHVINGKDGLSIWQEKRAEDRRLQQEIDKLKQENAQVRDHITSLNTDKDAIEREAREKLHYVRSGEIIFALPEPHSEPPQAK